MMIVQFTLAAGVVLPLFLLILTGYCLKQWKLYDDHTLKQLNNLTFSLFLPLHLFYSIYNSDFSTMMNIQVMNFIVVALLLIFMLCLLIIPIIEKNNSRRGVMIQGIVRNNYLIMGYPIMTSLFAKGELGIVALILAISMPIMNPMAVFALEIHRSSKVQITSLIKNVLKNPFVLSTLAGLAFHLFFFRLPAPIDKAVSDLSKLGTPLALLLLGASFRLDGFKKSAKQLMIVVITKLIVLPYFAYQISMSLGFSKLEIMALVIFFGAPTAVSTYAMARKMDGDIVLAQNIIIYSTFLSMITLVFWITFINALNI